MPRIELSCRVICNFKKKYTQSLRIYFIITSLVYIKKILGLFQSIVYVFEYERINQ
jgi:hypothetical protein